MFIESVLEIANMVFKPLKDLKKPKYKKLEIWNQGRETIDIGTPPTGNTVVKEIHQIQDEYRTATDEQKQQYINCDMDASYYIKLYMEDHDLDYDEDSSAEVDANFVLTKNSGFSEVQASGEENTFSSKTLVDMLNSLA